MIAIPRRDWLAEAFGWVVGCAQGLGCAARRPEARPVLRRFLALGDSYTIGESVRDTERWPVQLVSLLRARGLAVADPLVIARTGWTTEELSAAIDAARPRGTFDLVSVLIGVNDQYRQYPIDRYRARFRALLRRAIGFAGGEPARVVVLSIPDWGVTPFAAGRDRASIAAEIDAYNTINRDEAAAAGVHYVDVTPASRLAAAEPALIAADGLHPSAAMYGAWASELRPVAEAILRS